MHFLTDATYIPKKTLPLQIFLLLLAQGGLALAGGGKALPFTFSLAPPSDGVRQVRKRPLRLQDQPLADVRVHDQLRPQAQASAGEVHDEQCAGELHHSAGKDRDQSRDADS